MDIKLLMVIVAFSLASVVAGCGKKETTGTTAASTSQTKASATQEQASVPAAEEPSEPVEPTLPPVTEEQTMFSFEKSDDGFEIPGWAEEKADNAGRSVSLSKSYAAEGEQSLCVVCDFPGKIWSGAVIELEQYIDFTPWKQVAVDLYVPKDAPGGLKAKIILTIGEDWTWTEMVSSVPLVSGEWVTIRASLEPGTMMWKRTEVTDAFRADIRKIVIRIESNKRPVYNGPIYIDNIRVGR